MYRRRLSCRDLPPCRLAVRADSRLCRGGNAPSTLLGIIFLINETAWYFVATLTSSFAGDETPSLTHSIQYMYRHGGGLRPCAVPLRHHVGQPWREHRHPSFHSPLPLAEQPGLPAAHAEYTQALVIALNLRLTCRGVSERPLDRALLLPAPRQSCGHVNPTQKQVFGGSES